MEMARQALSLLGSMYPSLAGLGNQKVSADSAAQLPGLKPLDIPAIRHQVRVCRLKRALDDHLRRSSCCIQNAAGLMGDLLLALRRS